MLRDIALTLITRVAVIAAGLGTSIVTARTLGADGLGHYFFVITLATLATQFGSLGMVPANTFWLAGKKSLLPQIVGNSLWIAVVAGVVTSAVLVRIWSDPADVENFNAGLGLLFLIVPSMLFALLASNLFVGLSLYRKYNYFTLGSTALRVASVLLAAALSFTTYGFLWTNAIVGLGICIAVWWMLRSISTLRWRFDGDLFRRQVGYAARSYFAALFAFGVSRVGVIILESNADKSELGVFAVAQQFADVLALLPATVALIFFPELLKGDANQWYARTSGVARRVFGIMLIICAGTAAVVPFAIPFLFGDQFSEATIILLWMLPGMLLLSITVIFSQYLAAKGVPLQNIYVWAAGLLVLIVVGLSLVSDYGGIGIAAALSVTHAFVTIWIWILASRMSKADRLVGELRS